MFCFYLLSDPGKKPGFQIFISAALFLFVEMDLAELLGTVVIVQCHVAELLARQIERAIADDIEAMEVPVSERYAVNLSAVQILHQERRDRALPERFILRRPIAAHPRRAGVRAPDIGEQVVEVARRQSVRVFDIGGLPAVKLVF